MILLQESLSRENNPHHYPYRAYSYTVDFVFYVRQHAGNLALVCIAWSIGVSSCDL
jgi:hypothetical protein